MLEAAGYDVVIPESMLCCGRPLYDYGMLDLAKVFLREIIAALRPEIEAGTPIVVLEPSCASVFRDELLNLLPHDQDAKRLASNVLMFGEFLDREDWNPPRLERRATVHGHCHHKSVLGTEPDERVLAKMGVEARWLDDGCCGMAGAFGFEAGEHYDVSVKAGELGYLPHVRETPSDDIVMSDGFSCREQALQLTDREPLHLADVVWLALRYGPHGPPGRPERAALPDRRAIARRARRDAALAGVALLFGIAAGGAAWQRMRR